MEKATIDVLKNSAEINQGILIVKGNQIRTMSVMKNVFLVAKVPDVFEREFAIYDLGEFLSTISLFEKPEIELKDDHVLISSGKSKIKYHYSSPTVIVHPPKDKNITVSGSFSFNLSNSVLSQIIKASAVMGLDTIQISQDNLRAFNKKNGGNQYDVTLDETEGTINEKKYLSVDLLKLLPRDYTVTVGDRASKFKSIEGDLEYIITYTSLES